MSTGYLYAIQADGTPFIKIGSTARSVEQRVKALQTAHPLPLKILDTLYVPDDVQQMEKRVHSFLRKHRVKNEWFEIDMTHCRLADLVASALTMVAEDTHRLQAGPTKEEMAARIVSLRQKKGWGQAELARRAQIRPPTLHGYENCTRDPRGMSVDVAIRLTQALGVCVEYLYDGYSANEDSV